MTNAQPIVLIWSERPGAVVYRVVIWRPGSDEYHKYEVPDGSCRVPPGVLTDPRDYLWRVEFRDPGQDDWSPMFDYVVFPELRPPSPGIALSWPADGSAAYRVLVRSVERGEIVAKIGTVWPRLVLDPAELPDGELTYRVQRADGSSWRDQGEYIPLPEPAAVAEEPPPGPRVAIRMATPLERRPPGPRGYLLFTCDTEVNMRMMRVPDPSRAFDEQIYGRFGGEEAGIHAIMDLLDQYGVTGTFFVDVLMAYQFGEAPVRDVCSVIQERGHDVQLHLHPAPHLRFADDPKLQELHPALTRNDPELFARALEVGIETFERVVGKAPVAYRSGAYHLCDAFLTVLREHGITLDSSLYPYRNCRVSPWMWTRTQPFWFDGVLELPVSWILRDRPEGLSYEQLSPVLHPAAQTSVTRELRPPAEGPPLVLSYIAHSYSLLEKHDNPAADAAGAWNAAVSKVWPEAEYRAAKLADDAAVRYYDGSDSRRRSTLEEFLSGVAARGDIEAISLAEFGARDPQRLGFDATPRRADPLPEWHHTAREGRLTVSQRYSSWYLEHLEESA